MRVNEYKSFEEFFEEYNYDRDIEKENFMANTIAWDTTILVRMLMSSNIGHMNFHLMKVEKRFI